MQMTGFDFNERPFLVIWETTRACDLACIHCRASAQPLPLPGELDHEEAIKLINDVHELKTPILVFSGGDCLKRDDIGALIRYAKTFNIRTGAIPAVTPLLTHKKILDLQSYGLDQIAFSLDGSTAEEHDTFRQVPGVFERTLDYIKFSAKEGLSVQINSLVNVHNQKSLDLLINMVEKLDIVFWEVFFLVPTGRGASIPLMEAQKFEEAFEKIYALSKRVQFMIKITEAPHYRRFYFQKEWSQKLEKGEAQPHPGRVELPSYMRREGGLRGSIGRAPSGVNAGKGYVFISSTGEVMPSGFLPISAGNIRDKSLAEIYQKAEIFTTLRDSQKLKGRCGECGFRDICGGSRSRAFALTGDIMAEDPCCNYDPSKNEYPMPQFS